MTEPKRYLVTAALPYANGPVHIGHLAGCYLPADIYVRYLKAQGKDVVFICGSDEHGVPITIKAKKEGITPQQVVDKYDGIMKNAFKDFGIELWEVKQFENNTISINSIKKSNGAPSIKPLLENSDNLKEVKENIKVYTEEDHYNNGSDMTIELYEKFKTAILNLADNIEVLPQKFYIAFKKGSNISDIEMQKKALKIFI